MTKINAEPWEPLGQALLDELNGKKAVVKVYIKGGREEKLHASYFFRKKMEMPELEQYALSLCSGKILDIGAGAGSHSMYLQKKGIEVTALEISPLSCRVMEARGIKNVQRGDFFQIEIERFDMLLLLMNGIGFVGDLKGLYLFFKKARQLLNERGQILLDSSDLLFDLNKVSRWITNLGKSYPGEVRYELEYNGLKGKSYKWLFVDFKKLSSIAEENGFHAQMMFDEGDGRYLAMLRKI